MCYDSWSFCMQALSRFTLLPILLNNLSAVHFKLSLLPSHGAVERRAAFGVRMALHYALAVLAFDPKNIKAYTRAVTAAKALDWTDAACACAMQALEYHPKNAELRKLCQQMYRQDQAQPNSTVWDRSGNGNISPAVHLAAAAAAASQQCEFVEELRALGHQGDTPIRPRREREMIRRRFKQELADDPAQLRKYEVCSTVLYGIGGSGGGGGYK